jgi:hypothetical protein
MIWYQISGGDLLSQLGRHQRLLGPVNTSEEEEESALLSRGGGTNLTKSQPGLELPICFLLFLVVTVQLFGPFSILCQYFNFSNFNTHFLMTFSAKCSD